MRSNIKTVVKEDVPQTTEQTKVIQEVVRLDVSKLDHAVMNKKQGNQMHFSLEKKTRKNKTDSSNPSYQSMECVIK